MDPSRREQAKAAVSAVLGVLLVGVAVMLWFWPGPINPADRIAPGFLFAIPATILLDQARRTLRDAGPVP